jgi:hypothetical protein
MKTLIHFVAVVSVMAAILTGSWAIILPVYLCAFCAINPE